MKGERNLIKITGGTFSQSAIGIGRTEQHGSAVGSAVRLADLRTELAARHDEIVAHGRSAEEREDLRHELRKIREELNKDEPDGPAVKSRWRSILEVLEGALVAGTTITGITELVRQVFGAS